MSLLSIVLYVLIISANTPANFVLWVQFNSYQKELAKQSFHDSD